MVEKGLIFSQKNYVLYGFSSVIYSLEYILFVIFVNFENAKTETFEAKYINIYILLLCICHISHCQTIRGMYVLCITFLIHIIIEKERFLYMLCFLYNIYNKKRK
jgi:hypothetical protein